MMLSNQGCASSCLTDGLFCGFFSRACIMKLTASYDRPDGYWGSWGVGGGWVGGWEQQ